MNDARTRLWRRVELALQHVGALSRLCEFHFQLGGRRVAATDALLAAATARGVKFPLELQFPVLRLRELLLQGLELLLQKGALVASLGGRIGWPTAWRLLRVWALLLSATVSTYTCGSGAYSTILRSKQ